MRRAAKLSVCILAALFLMCLAYVLASSNPNLSVVHEILSEQAAVLWFLRWLLILMLVWFWPLIVDLVARAKDLNDEQQKAALSVRWRLATALIIFELLVVEGVQYLLL